MTMNGDEQLGDQYLVMATNHRRDSRQKWRVASRAVSSKVEPNGEHEVAALMHPSVPCLQWMTVAIGAAGLSGSWYVSAGKNTSKWNRKALISAKLKGWHCWKHVKHKRSFALLIVRVLQNWLWFSQHCGIAEFGSKFAHLIQIKANFQHVLAFGYCRSGGKCVHAAGDSYRGTFLPILSFKNRYHRTADTRSTLHFTEHKSKGRSHIVR